MPPPPSPSGRNRSPPVSGYIYPHSTMQGYFGSSPVATYCDHHDGSVTSGFRKNVTFLAGPTIRQDRLFAIQRIVSVA